MTAGLNAKLRGIGRAGAGTTRTPKEARDKEPVSGLQNRRKVGRTRAPQIETSAESELRVPGARIRPERSERSSEIHPSNLPLEVVLRQSPCPAPPSGSGVARDLRITRGSPRRRVGPNENSV